VTSLQPSGHPEGFGEINRKREADMAKANKAQDAAAKIDAPDGPMIEISCPSGPRRRAGLSLGPVPVTVAAGDLTEDQIKMIKDDALLVLRPSAGEVEVEAGQADS
jgi:hypothetical protein